MTLDQVEFQSTELATPAVGTDVGVKTVDGNVIQVVNLDVGGDGEYDPLVRGQQANAESLPVALSTEQQTILAAIKTASEALAVIAASGTLKVDDDATKSLLSTIDGHVDGLETLAAATNTALGLITALITGGALKVDDDATQVVLSTIDGHVDGLETLVTATNAALGLLTALISGGALKVDDDATQTLLSTIDGHVDGLETLVGATNTALAALLADATFTGRIGEVQANPTANTVLDRLKTIGTQVTALAGAISASRLNVSGNIRAAWTDGTQVLGITTLAKGAVSRTTFAVPTKLGAYVYVFLARTGTTALDKAVHVRLRRIVNGVTQLAPEAAFDSDILAAVSGVCAGSGNNLGVTSLTLNAAKTYVVGTNGEIWLAVLDSTSSPTWGASEWVRVSVQTSTTVKLLDAPTLYAHNNTAHNVADKANVFKMYVEGGCTYELIIDYGEATTGDTYVVAAYAQTLDSLAVAA